MPPALPGMHHHQHDKLYNCTHAVVMRRMIGCLHPPPPSHRQWGGGRSQYKENTNSLKTPWLRPWQCVHGPQAAALSQGTAAAVRASAAQRRCATGRRCRRRSQRSVPPPGPFPRTPAGWKPPHRRRPSRRGPSERARRPRC